MLQLEGTGPGWSQSFGYLKERKGHVNRLRNKHHAIHCRYMNSSERGQFWGLECEIQITEAP